MPGEYVSTKTVQRWKPGKYVRWEYVMPGDTQLLHGIEGFRHHMLVGNDVTNPKV